MNKIIPILSKIKPIGPYIILVLMTVVAFFPAFFNGFTNWDDPRYVVDNPLIRQLSWANIQTIFSTIFIGNHHYHPLTMLSWALDYHFVGLNPWLFHAHNIFLHVLNTLLVYSLIMIWKPDVKVAFLTAIFFAVHPMHVESVAWITERKDLLYSFFFLCGLIQYSRYVQLLENKGRQCVLYVQSFIIFVCALLSKPAAITFPIVIILIDYYYGRFKWLDKIPFFVLSLLIGWLATRQYVQTPGFEQAVYPFIDRVFMSAYTFNTYLWKLIWPGNLSCYYPFPKKINGSLPNVFLWAPALTLIIISGLIFFTRRSRLAQFGLLFFLVSIGLNLGLIPFAPFLMAERYTYLSYLGLFFVLANGLILLDERFLNNRSSTRIILFLILFILVGTNLFLSNLRCRVWHDNETLWTNAIQQFPKAALPYHNRAIHRFSENRWEEALSDFNQALKLNPNYWLAYTNRAKCYLILNQPQEAINDLSISLKLAQTKEAYFNRAAAYARMGNYQDAFNDMSMIQEDFRDNVDFQSDYGVICKNLKHYDDALKAFDRALTLQPKHSRAYFNRSSLWQEQGRYDLALEDLNSAILFQPDYVKAYYNRAMLLFNRGEKDLAEKDFAKLKELGISFRRP